MTLVVHKRARYEYSIEKTFTAGMVLEGREVKSLRLKHASLTGSYIKILSGELYLINAQINPYSFADNKDYDPKRTRKLLVKKRELLALQSLLEKKQRTLVPLKIFTAGRFIKLEFGLGKGLKKFEKRAKIRERDLARQDARGVRH